MSWTPEDEERVRYLLTVFSNKRIDQAEINELNEWLIREPQARRLYFEDTGLQLALHDQPQSKSISQEMRLQEARPRRTRSPRRAARKKPMSLWPLLGAAVAAVLCIIVYNYQSESQPSQQGTQYAANDVQLAAKSGSVWLDQAHTRAAQRDAWYAAGTQWFTADNGIAELRFTDETRIRLPQRSVLGLVRTHDRHKELHLYSGALSADVAAQPTGRALIIQTRHAVVTVVGTRFDIQCTGQLTQLDLHQGRVRFLDKTTGISHDLEAGDSIIARVPDKQSTDLQQQTEPVPVKKNQAALVRYAFDEGEGTLIRDSSKRGEPLHLNIGNSEAVEWQERKGLRISGVADIISQEAATTLSQAIKSSGELSIVLKCQTERINPLTPKVGMDRMLSLSKDFKHRNFSLGVGELTGDPTAFALRTRHHAGGRGVNGMPSAVTPPIPEQHKQEVMLLIVSRDSDGRIVFNLNGRQVHEEVRHGSFAEWDENYYLALGQEVEPSIIGGSRRQLKTDVAQARAWLGTIYHLEIYDRALSPKECMQLQDRLQ